MKSTFEIQPAEPGLIVRDPETLTPLEAEGEPKPRNGYWLARLRDRDVKLADKPKKKGSK